MLEWESRERAAAFWGRVYGKPELMNKGGLAGPGNPFWPEDEPMKHYARIESSWMHAATGY